MSEKFQDQTRKIDDWAMAYELEAEVSMLLILIKQDKHSILGSKKYLKQ